MINKKDVAFNKSYWDRFYKHNFKHTPSQFCVSVLTELDNDAVIVELGSGNGRDSLYFSSQGHVTIALDLSHEAIASCESEAKKRQVNHSYFVQADLTDKQQIKSIIAKARIKAKNLPLTFYSRFVIHSLDDNQEKVLLATLSENIQMNEKVYFEFRSQEDANLDKHFGGHYRRYVDTEKFFLRLKNGGFEIEYQIIGQGMAKYKEEDPFVARIIAVKS
ncbi:MAG: class I SAM-dependent methyltransferase [Proteobacteria bacterium]|nr:class I SAM-dependent methyltransferase [Pseudomonadota bacterium]